MNWLFKKIGSSHNARQGFTLIELVLAMFVFSVVISSVGVAFVNILDLQRRGVGAQKVQENAMYMFELMAREIRVSRIEFQDSLDCSATSLTMLHPVNGSVTYAYDPTLQRVFRSAALSPSDPLISSDLNSLDVAVNRFNFCIIGSDPADNQQVRVGLVTQMQIKESKSANTVVFDLQTMVTSRDITTEYQE